MDRIKLLTLQASLSSRQGAWDKAEVYFAGRLPSAMRKEAGLHDWSTVLRTYAIALRKNHHAREARAIEKRMGQGSYTRVAWARGGRWTELQPQSNHSTNGDVHRYLRN